ncbi:MAG: F0F1 ATP synthase subunit B [Magnetococcales bacterium]|nr:F0F1 ATP synthase subunit B [Magnetococcales bacterium]
MISIAHAAAAAEGHAEASSGGFPQFDANFFSSQAFWAVVSFVVLMYLLNKHVIPAVNQVLDARGKTIEDEITNAKSMREEADKVLTEYKQKLTDAAKESAETLEQARQEASKHRDQALSELDQELAKTKDQALAAIDQEKRKAVEEIKTMAVDIAMLATEKLINKSVNKTDANKMVNEAITELKEGDKAIH